MPKDNDAAVAASGTPTVDMGDVLATLTKLAERIDALEQRLSAIERAFPIKNPSAPRVEKTAASGVS